MAKFTYNMRLCSMFISHLSHSGGPGVPFAIRPVLSRRLYETQKIQNAKCRKQVIKTAIRKSNSSTQITRGDSMFNTRPRYSCNPHKAWLLIGCATGRGRSSVGLTPNPAAESCARICATPAPRDGASHHPCRAAPYSHVNPHPHPHHHPHRRHLSWPASRNRASPIWPGPSLARIMSSAPNLPVFIRLACAHPRESPPSVPDKAHYIHFRHPGYARGMI